MNEQTVLLLHPGEMGSAVGARLGGIGHTVLWVGNARSDKTRAQAQSAGLVDCGSIEDGLSKASLVISVCPPHGATELAGQVAGLMKSNNFNGIYLDANAIAPQTSHQIRTIVTNAGASYIDGGIIGPPPTEPKKARLYLSGAGADKLAEQLNAPPLTAIALPVNADPCSASALKMCFAGWNKARTALLINLRSLAMQHQVDDALLAEWSTMDPDLINLFDGQKPGGNVLENARKAWRWSGEMREIARTFSDSGLPDGFHQGAADVFDRLDSFKDSSERPEMTDLATAMRDYKRS